MDLADSVSPAARQQLTCSSNWLSKKSERNSERGKRERRGDLVFDLPRYGRQRLSSPARRFAVENPTPLETEFLYVSVGMGAPPTSGR